MVKFLISVVTASAAFVLFAMYEGDKIQSQAWRGETVYMKIPDNMAYEMMPYNNTTNQGVSIKLYGLLPVAYAEDTKSPNLRYRKDLLVDLSADNSMKSLRDMPPPSVCEIVVPTSAKRGVRDFGPLQVRVIDRVLPPVKDWKYFLDLWQHPWAVSRYFDVKPFSKEHYAAMEPVWRMLASGGVKALTVTLLDLPWNHQCYDAYHSMVERVKKDDGTWSFDYKLFDEYVEFGRKCGIGPDIACYTMCPWGYVVRWKNERGEICRVKAIPGTKEFEDYWGDFLVDFTKHLKEKGWFEDAYIAMDERSPEDVSKIAAFIQKKSPGMKIAMAGNRKPSEFKGIVVDNYCQYLGYLTDDFFAELAPRREKGWKTTLYVCCSPGYPNTFMESGDEESFYLGAFPAICGFDGFLRWAANSWPHNPYRDTTFGNWKPGDTFLVYPNGEASIRFIYLRNGVVAAEKIRLMCEAGLLDAKELQELNKKYGYKDALNRKLDMKKFEEAINRLVNR